MSTPFPIVQVPDLKNDGSVRDLANPLATDFTWQEMANGLSKIARFNGRYSCAAYSVGQHLVMGADAVLAETGDPVVAAYFLLHDAHEFFIGDVTRPTINLIDFYMVRGAGLSYRGVVKSVINTIKQTFDVVIWEKAGLPHIYGMPTADLTVRNMDERMLRAEALSFYGARAGEHLPASDLPAPKLTGALRPWGAMKTEEAWLTRLDRYLGIDERGAS